MCMSNAPTAQPARSNKQHDGKAASPVMRERQTPAVQAEYPATRPAQEGGLERRLHASAHRRPGSCVNPVAPPRILSGLECRARIGGAASQLQTLRPKASV